MYGLSANMQSRRPGTKFFLIVAVVGAAARADAAIIASDNFGSYAPGTYFNGLTPAAGSGFTNNYYGDVATSPLTNNAPQVAAGRLSYAAGTVNDIGSANSAYVATNRLTGRA